MRLSRRAVLMRDTTPSANGTLSEPIASVASTNNSSNARSSIVNGSVNINTKNNNNNSNNTSSSSSRSYTPKQPKKTIASIAENSY